MLANAKRQAVGALVLCVVSVGCQRGPTPVATVHEAEQHTPLIDIATDSSDPLNYDDSEPSIAVNPTNPNEIAVVAFSGAWDGSNMAPVWKSSNGGQSWRKVFQLPQPGQGLDGPGDQKISFDKHGHLYVAELGIDNPGSPDEEAHDFIYHQVSGADDALKVGALYGDDQPHVAVDIFSNRCPDDIYSAWLKTQVTSGQTDQSMDSLSKDGGEHLQDVSVGSKLSDRTTRVAVGPDGKAYVVFKTREGAINDTFEKVHFRVRRSDDCGTTYNGLGVNGVSVHGNAPAITFFTDKFGNPAKGKVARARSSDAWIAASATPGEVYVAYVDKTNETYAQIFVARTADGGITWKSARITDGTHHSAYPEIAVAKDGAVGVLYVDFDDSGQRTLFRHRFALSQDRGQTWENRTLQVMNPDILVNVATTPGDPRAFLWGDYEGLTAAANTFYGVFTGESINRRAMQLDPIFFKVSANAQQSP